MQDIYEQEIVMARAALQRRDYACCFHHLERAHIVSILEPVKHVRTHWLMLRAAIGQRNVREIIGQIPRLMVSIFIPQAWAAHGNTGRASVSPFKAMSPPEDMRVWVESATARQREAAERQSKIMKGIISYVSMMIVFIRDAKIRKTLDNRQNGSVNIQ